MRKMVGIAAVCSILVVPGCMMTAFAGTSIQLSFTSHPEYVIFNDIEEDMNWDNMVVIDNNRVGFWVMQSSGRWVFRCRDMWYDNSCDEWRYGPWWYDYNVSYYPQYGINFHIYMNQHYPRYHTRYFYRNNGAYLRYNHSNRGYNSYGHSAPHMDRNGPVVVREKRSMHQVNQMERERSRTTVITREPARPVRTDGGDRISRTSNSRFSGGQSQVVRERSTTRVQPSSNSTRTTRTQTRSEIKRR